MTAPHARHLYKFKCAILSVGRGVKCHIVPPLSFSIPLSWSATLRAVASGLSAGRIFTLKFNMGCCFSKELNHNLVGERTSLLQTSVTESCTDQDVKQYSSVTELAEEKHSEYGQTNRAMDMRSDASSTKLSASLSACDMGSRTVAWDEFNDDSRNKSLGGVSKDSDLQTETAVLKSVRRRIAENAIKRANWFCEVESSQRADSTRFKPRYESKTAADALEPNGCHVTATCTSDDVSLEVSITQEHVQAECSTNQKPDVFFTTKYLYDGLLDSDEKRSDFLTSGRTQSFYSICSIDADDLGGEQEPAAMTQPAAFDHADLLANTETKVFINTSLSNAALETFIGTKETQEDGEIVSKDLPAEALPHVLPDVIGTFCDASPREDAGSREDAVSETHVSVPPEDIVMEMSGKHRHTSHITGLHKTVDETIPDLLEGNGRLSDSVVDHTDVDCTGQTRVNTDAELMNELGMTEMGCELLHCSETPEQELKSVSSQSRISDNQESHLNSCVDCREPKPVEPNTEVDLSVMREVLHELEPCSRVKPDHEFLCSEVSSISQFVEDEPSSFVTSSLESDLKRRGFITENSFRDADVLNLSCKSCLSPAKDGVTEPAKSICSYAEREDPATEPEPRSKFNSPQNLNCLTSEDISGGNGDALQPVMFQTGLVDYSGFDACSLLSHCDAEKREINFGMEDVTCHISSTELSDLAQESERVETSENSVHVNSNTDYRRPLHANQSLVKDLGDALQNPEDLKTSEKQMFPAIAQERFNMKEDDDCCLKEKETLIKPECFNEHVLEGPNQILLSICPLKTPEKELQYSRSMDFDFTFGRNNDEQVMCLFLEGSRENATLSVQSSGQAEPHDTFECATLSINSTQCQSAHVLTHTFLGKTHVQSSSEPPNHEPELTHRDVQDVHTIGSAEQQVVINYRVPLGRTMRPMFEIGEPAHALEGHDRFDEGVESFVTSRLQGYQLDGLHASGCSLGTAGMCPILNFSDDNKAIPLPVEPGQVDLYASTPSYEIHFLSPNAITVPVQVENPQSLTSTNDLERERGVLNMVSDLLGKSEVNEDGDCSHFLSVWAREPELESAWQYGLSEADLMERDGQEEGKADSALDSKRVQAFTEAYPYSLVVSDGACVWDWQNTYGEPVSLHHCCVAS